MFTHKAESFLCPGYLMVSLLFSLTLTLIFWYFISSFTIYLCTFLKTEKKMVTVIENMWLDFVFTFWFAWDRRLQILSILFPVTLTRMFLVDTLF